MGTVQYNINGGNWVAVSPQPTTDGPNSFALPSLTAGTTYNIGLAIDGLVQNTRSFSTLSNPTLTAISSSAITQTSATINYTYTSYSTSITPDVEYSINGGAWTPATTQPTTDNTYTINLPSLTLATAYTVSLRLNGVTQGSTSFTTNDYTQDNIDVTNVTAITQTSATVNYTYTQGTTPTHGTVQYNINGGSWQDVATQPTSDASYSFDLPPLTAGTTYHIGMAIDGVSQDVFTFTTLQNPSLSAISSTANSQTTGTINYTYTSNSSTTTPDVEYSLNGGTWTPATTQPTTDDDYTIDLTDLTLGTLYVVNLKLNDVMQGTTTFTTTDYAPDTVVATNITTLGQTFATVNYTYTQGTTPTHGLVQYRNLRKCWNPTHNRWFLSNSFDWFNCRNSI